MRTFHSDLPKPEPGSDSQGNSEPRKITRTLGLTLEVFGDMNRAGSGRDFFAWKDEVHVRSIERFASGAAAVPAGAS